MKYLKSYKVFESKLVVDKEFEQFLNYYSRNSYNSVVNYLSTMMYNDDYKTELNNLRVDLKALDTILVSPEKRQNQNISIKIGRLIRKISNDNKFNFKDSEIEQFVNFYKSYFNKDKNIKIVEGEDIRYWYDYRNYSDISYQKSLGNSCMSNTPNYLNMYVDNPEVCRLVIQVDDQNKLTARALLWKLEDGRYMLDRIYTSQDFQQQSITKWVLENVNNSIARPNENELNQKKYSVRLKKWEYETYPYLDSLPFLEIDIGRLTNIRDSNYPNLYLKSTHGVGKMDSNWVFWKSQNTWIKRMYVIFDHDKNDWVLRKWTDRPIGYWIDKFNRKRS